MLVGERGVLVDMLVPLGEMEIEAERHQRPASARLAVTASPSSATASTAPMKGAVEK